jgi:hypothetical protein
LDKEQLMQLLQGASSGASTGAKLGSVIPGVGNIAGGVIGGVLGAGANYYNNNKVNAPYTPTPAGFAKYGIEVEGGETLMRGDGSYAMFNGPSHSNGGINYTPRTKSEFVFSDTAGYNNGNISMKGNKTFAKLSKKYLGKEDAVSSGMLNQLKADNKTILKYGGMTSKYAYGGNVDASALPELAVNDAAYDFANYVKPIAKANAPVAPVNHPFPQMVNAPITGPTPINTNNMYNNMMNAAGSLMQPTPVAPVNNLASIPYGPSSTPANKPNVFGRASQKYKALDDNAKMGLQNAAFHAPGIAYNLINGMMKPEVEALRMNQQGQTAINLTSDLKYDPTQVYTRINEGANIGRNSINNQALSPFLRNALNQGVTNNAMGALADANLQGQQMNNQYRSQEASTRFQVGAGNANERIRKQTADSQNKAARANFLQAGLGDIANLGDLRSKYQLNKAQNKDTLSILNNISTHFKVDPEVMMKFLKDSGIDIETLKFKE